MLNDERGHGRDDPVVGLGLLLLLLQRSGRVVLGEQRVGLAAALAGHHLAPGPEDEARGRPGYAQGGLGVPALVAHHLAGLLGRVIRGRLLLEPELVRAAVASALRQPLQHLENKNGKVCLDDGDK